MTSNGHLDATTDLARIDAWWRKHPTASVGIACGPSRLAVLDVDPRHGGDDQLAELGKVHGPLPSTWRVLTGGGGLHLPFRAPDGVALVEGDVARGLDFKANGYIVAALSLHVSGQRYVWEVGYEPWSLPLAIAAGLAPDRRTPQMWA